MHKEYSSYSTLDFVKRAIIFFGYVPKTIQTDNGAEFTHFLKTKRVVEGSGIKENIVVKKPSAIYRYPFALICENVTARFDEKAKRIAFISNESGDEVFFIPAPFMTDANGITSTAVNFEVKMNANGLLLFTVTADADWMNSPKRAFPVIIDPQIKLSGNTNMSTYSWDDGSLFNASLHTIGTVANDTTYATSPDCSPNTANSMKTAITMSLSPRLRTMLTHARPASTQTVCI